jgi:type IV pilus assembly protein PilV
LQKDRGFTLIEILVALVILSVGLLALISISLTVMKSNAFADKMTMATTLAQDRLEEIQSTAYEEVNSVNFPSEDYGAISGFSAFRREVTIANDFPLINMKTITVTVLWRDGAGNSHNIQLKTVIRK